VLRAVAGRFLSRLRPTDSIYRYGGEEFLISLPNANAGMARSVLERLRRALEERPIGLEDGSEVAVTASFGVANVTGDTDLQSVMERADQALYAAKEAGRNRVLGWRETDETESGEDADDGAGRPETG
jgi:diguanylate cyclase (GGDEF)-like protein